jgi:PAS domain S-box-containing protein
MVREERQHGGDGESLGGALRTCREVLPLLAEDIPMGIMLVDGQGSCVYFNSTCTKITGYTLDDLRNNHRICRDVCSEALKGATSAAERETLSQRSATDREVHVKCKNGIVKPLRVRTAFFTDGGAVVFLEDVTDRSLNPAFLVQDGLFSYVNTIFAETYGYPAEELIGRLGLRDLVLPEDWPGLEREMKRQLTAGQAQPMHREVRCLTRRGEVIYVEVHSAPTIVNGTPAMVGTVVDITRHKISEERLRRAEEKYRNIFENSVAGIYQTTPDAKFLSANLAVARIHGYDSVDELVETITDIGKQLYVSQARRAEFSQMIREQGFVEGFEAEMRRKDGSVNWVSLNTRAVLDDQGHVLHLEGSLQDVTERKKLESQLQESQKMEAIGTLAGGVAHDFNNLLMGIQGYTSLMLFNIGSSHDHFEKLKNIEKLVRSGADLTKQLLGFARAGRYQVKSSDLNEILKNVTAMFMRSKKEITVHEKYEEGLYLADLDRGQIEQAFLNVYVNAWQAMPGGGHLYIETHNTTLDKKYVKSYSVHPGRYAKVSVTDTGVGMDKRTMKRIFEPFFTTKEMGRGTGLGLASVYGIINGHKGFINVYSQVGHGTTFNIYLPASKKEARRMAEAPEELVRGSETILLVDDEDIIINVGKEILEALGYTVITASGGREAIDIYGSRKDEIGLVILDMIMPDMEGGRTFDVLKGIKPEVRVMLASGYSLNSEAESIMQRGCKAFMQKPFNVYSLSLKIREILEGPP